MIEVEEIMDESETFSPKEYMKSLNVPPVLAFLPKFYMNMIQNSTDRMYVQFCFYKEEWVLAGFRDGDGSLGTLPGVSDNYAKALFIKTITGTEVCNEIHIDSTFRLQDKLEAKAIKEGLKELFTFVSVTHANTIQGNRSVGWYVKGVKK